MPVYRAANTTPTTAMLTSVSTRENPPSGRVEKRCCFSFIRLTNHKHTACHSRMTKLAKSATRLLVQFLTHLHGPLLPARSRGCKAAAIHPRLIRQNFGREIFFRPRTHKILSVQKRSEHRHPCHRLGHTVPPASFAVR